jgi:hypothetical protein
VSAYEKGLAEETAVHSMFDGEAHMDSDIRQLLEQQQAEIREIRARLDALIDPILIIQFLLVMHSTDGEELEEFEPKELLELVQNKQKTAREKMELLLAARRKTPPSQIPPSAHN